LPRHFDSSQRMRYQKGQAPSVGLLPGGKLFPPFRHRSPAVAWHHRVDTSTNKIVQPSTSPRAPDGRCWISGQAVCTAGRWTFWASRPTRSLVKPQIWDMHRTASRDRRHLMQKPCWLLPMAGRTQSAAAPHNSSVFSAMADERFTKLASWINAVPKKLWRLGLVRTLSAFKATDPISHQGDGHRPAALCSAQYKLYAEFVGRQEVSGDADGADVVEGCTVDAGSDSDSGSGSASCLHQTAGHCPAAPPALHHVEYAPWSHHA